MSIFVCLLPKLPIFYKTSKITESCEAHVKKCEDFMMLILNKKLGHDNFMTALSITT